ncbi:MAG: ScyD/ScyE family protein [Candidatus Promineifilaceae bacterium]
MSQRVKPILVSTWLAAVMAAAVILAAQAGVASALSPLTVIASGLDNPHGLAFAADGTLYIAESGSGGPGLCIPSAGDMYCYGDSGAISRVLPDGTQERVVSDLPSIAPQAPITNAGFASHGPFDVGFDAAGDLFVLTGLGADPALRADLDPGGANLAQLIAVGAGGTWTPTLDIGAYETANNPDNGAVDTNPYVMVPVADGWALTDAGANDLLHVDLANTISTLAVFPTRTVEFPPGTPIPMDAVPTGVAQESGGDYLVGQLTGFPFPVDGANVYHVPAAGGTPTEVYTGFTNIVDVALAADGTLYVLEIATNSLLAGDGVGALIRVNSDGSQEIIASDGLVFPTALTLGPDGAIYVSNFGIFPIAAGGGQVVRISQTPTAVGLSDFDGQAAPPWRWAVLALALLPPALWLAGRRRWARPTA